MKLRRNLIVICMTLVHHVFASPQDVISENNDDECECVPFYLCANNTINTDGSGIIDRRLDRITCADSIEVCCGQKLSQAEVNKTLSVEAVTECGKRNADGVGFRVVGGDEKNSQFGEFPWMVAILEELQLSNELHKVFICGGSLIHEKVVLTAAHCVDKKSASTVVLRAGEWDTQTTQEPLPHQDRRATQVIIHENYNPKTLLYDVALVVSSEPFVIAGNVRTICLPKNVNPSSEESECWVSGWGKNRFGKQGNFQVILRKVPLPLVENERCQEEFRKTRLGPKFQLHKTFTCAGGIQGVDACEGDGGGPLVCPVKGSTDRYQQVGIVAWGIGCGTETPGAYANVGEVKSWIDQKMKELNLIVNYNY